MADTNHLPDQPRHDPYPIAPANKNSFAAIAARDALEDQLLRPEEGGLSPRALLAMVQRRLWLLCGVLALGLVTTALITLLQTPIYRSTASIEIQREQSRVIDEGEVQPTTVADQEHIATQSALLRSRTLAERVVETLDLASDPRYAKPELDRPARVRQATGILMRGLTVAPLPRSRVIEVRFNSPYPEESARIVTAVVENFIQSNLERRYNDTAYARSFLQERLDSTKTSLEEAERKLVEYSRAKQLLTLGDNDGGPKTGGSLNANSLIDINAALNEAQRDRIAAEQNYLQYADNPKAASSLTNASIAVLGQQRAALIAEYQQKLSRFKPEFPEMQELQRRIDSLEEQIGTEQQMMISGMKTAFDSARAREDALAKRVGELKSEMQDVQQRSIDYTILAREVDTLRTQYNALLQRFKEVSIASGIGTSQVSIVDPGVVPTRPHSPRLLNNLLFGLLISIGLGVALALLLEHIDDTISAPEDVKTKLGLPLIGVVPKIKGKQAVAELLRDPRSPVSEAFGSIRTALQFASAAGAPRSILVTGNRPSEGKSSTVLGTAAAFAAIGKRVLIVDADMRRPCFVADPGASIGLSGVLTQNVRVEGEIVTGELGNVYLLPAGTIPPNPAELLASQRFVDLLRGLETQFDLVLVDAPPVLDFADAPVLSSVCEATMIVTQSGAVRRPMALRTLDRLRFANANIIGVIITKFNVERAGYGYSYSYGYRYGGYQATSDKGVSAEVNTRRRISVFADKQD